MTSTVSMPTFIDLRTAQCADLKNRHGPLYSEPSRERYLASSHQGKVSRRRQAVREKGLGHGARRLHGSRYAFQATADKLTWFQAVTDFPCAIFAEELIAAFPEAKVILNNRPVDDWYRSVVRTIGRAQQDPLQQFLALTGDPFWLRFTTMSRTMWSGFFGLADHNIGFGGAMMHEETLKRRYLEHYDHVRKLVPPGRLLEKDLTEGWERMCAFLSQEVPQLPYPRVNDQEEFQKSMGVMISAGVTRLSYRCMKFVLLLLLVALSLCFYAAAWARIIIPPIIPPDPSL